MKSAILMASVAAVVLAAPALAGPDRFPPHSFSCSVFSDPCKQQQLTNLGGKPASDGRLLGGSEVRGSGPTAPVRH